jgi:integrase
MRRWKRLDEKTNRLWVIEFDAKPIQSVKVALGRAIALAGLFGGVSAYTLRHSCASWLVAKGLPTRKIAEFLGTSEATIIKHYGRLAPDYQDEAVTDIGRK